MTEEQGSRFKKVIDAYAQVAALLEDENSETAISLDALNAALKEIEELRAKQVPRPMDTAPKDGKLILLFGEVEGSQSANGGAWVKSCFRGDFQGDTRPYWHWGAPGYSGQVMNPTHWMPLPAPPGAAARKENAE